MSADEQNKSEQATAYKLDQARKKGMVPRSADAGMVVSLAACAGYLWIRGDQLVGQISALDARALQQAAYLVIDSQAVLSLFGSLVTRTAAAIAPLIAIAVGAAVVGSVLQTGLLFAPAALKADMARLNPAEGFKRVFSVQTLIEAVKACIKMVVYGVIIWRSVAAIVKSAVHAPLSASALGTALLHHGLKLITTLLAAALVFALIDQVIVRRAFAKKMRMSRHEIRQEHKQREGDGDGRYIDFRNTTILLTSNVGSELTASLCADPALAPDAEGLRDALAPELLKVFPAAFLGRVTVVPYRPLASLSLARIVCLHLDRVVHRMAETHQITLTYDEPVVDYIVGRCLVQETGARVLIGFIEQHVLPRLSTLWLDAFSSKQPLSSIDIVLGDRDAPPATALIFRFPATTQGRLTDGVNADAEESLVGQAL